MSNSLLPPPWVIIKPENSSSTFRNLSSRMIARKILVKDLYPLRSKTNKNVLEKRGTIRKRSTP